MIHALQPKAVEQLTRHHQYPASSTLYYLRDFCHSKTGCPLLLICQHQGCRPRTATLILWSSRPSLPRCCQKQLLVDTEENCSVLSGKGLFVQWQSINQSIVILETWKVPIVSILEQTTRCTFKTAKEIDRSSVVSHHSPRKDIKWQLPELQQRCQTGPEVLLKETGGALTSVPYPQTRMKQG